MSIRLRLAAWYAGSVLVLFLATGLLLRLSLRETLQREHWRGAERSVEVAQGIFRMELAEYATVPGTIDHVLAELVLPDQVLEFVAPDGTVRAPPATRRPASRLAPPVHRVERPLDPDLAPGWRVRVDASMAPLHESLRRIDRSLLLIVPLTVLLAAVTGGWLTGRTLRPVGEMAAAAEAIMPATPGARVPVVNARDELGRLARRINDLLRRLEGALAQQRRFLADAAHELRTPVARMLTQAERGLDRGGDADAALHLIRDDLESTSALIGKLLQLARVDAGEPAPPLEPGYLDDVVASGIQRWYAMAERRGISLRIAELEEAPARLHPELIGRLLGILVDNAIRYTPDGGRVEVSVRDEAGRPVLEVRDGGIGIPEGERDRLFERFYRGRAARRLAPEGSGLGLPIARWIAGLPGGAYALSCPPAGGTAARVELPPPPSSPAPVLAAARS
jgi:signal transduction histidine kinase